MNWLKESFRFKDFCTEVLYANQKTTLDAFEHDVSGISVVFQGSESSCVSCSVTFIQQWIEKNHPNLSHEWLASLSNTGKDGVEPSKVLEPARTIGICSQEVWDNDRDMGYLDAGKHMIAGYAKSVSLKPEHLAWLIERCPIMVGVDDFMGKGPHMMAAVGFNLSENVVKCANWWRLDKQDFVSIPFNDIVFACSILTDKPVEKPIMPMLDVLKDKLSFIPKKWLVAGGVILLALSLLVGGERMFGAGYTPVTGYQSRTTSYLSTTATTIPVASTKDKAGNQISLSSISPSSTVRVYLNVEAGTSREELVACTGVTVSSWTNCIRGMSFQGGAVTASSTLAKAHNAGSSVMITNIGQFYGEYISVDGAQNVYGTKTFYAFPTMNTSAVLPTLGAQLATKQYVDTVGAGGFTAANVSTTRGLSVDGSAPEKVGIKLTTGYGLRFLSGGSLVISTSTALTWSGAQTMASLVATSTSLGLTKSPTQGTDVMNLQSGVWSMATGTAKLAVTAGRALWVSSTSTLAHTSTAAASSTFQYVGIALNSASVGQTVRYAKPGGVACGLSGLAPGMAYFLNGTAGQLGTTPGAKQARIGTAISSSCLQLSSPRFYATGTLAFTSAAAFSATTGFYPARISLVGPTNTGVKGCISVDGDKCTDMTGTLAKNYAVYTDEATDLIGTVTSRSVNGFTITISSYPGAQRDFYWAAESF